MSIFLVVVLGTILSGAFGARSPQEYVTYKTSLRGVTVYRWEQMSAPPIRPWQKVNGQNHQRGELSYFKAYSYEYEYGGYDVEMNICEVTYANGKGSSLTLDLVTSLSCNDVRENYMQGGEGTNGNAYGILDVRSKFSFWVSEDYSKTDGNSKVYLSMCKKETEPKWTLYSTITNSPTTACSGGTELVGDTYYAFKGRVFCPTLRDVGIGQSKSTASWEDGIRETSATYDCVDGFQYDDGTQSTTLSCSNSGRWSKELPECKRISCGAPEKPEHGRIIGTDFEFEDTVSIKCDTGYELFPNHADTLQCLASKQWSVSEVECKRRSCGYPGEISNGHVRGAVYVFEGTLTFECDHGYKLEGEKSATCNHRGQWNASLPHCSRIECESIRQPRNGIRDGQTFTTGSVVKFSCYQSFRLVGPKAINCEERDGEGVWDAQPPTCHKITCEKPADILNGEIRGEVYTYEKQVHIRCNAGYVLNGSDHATCREEGWDTDFPTCTPRVCRDLGNPENGHKKENISGRYVYTDMVEFECDAGFTREGSHTLICGENGRWDNKVPECNPITCPKLPKLQNGGRDNDQVTFGSLLNFHCYPGYELLGDAQVICQVSGQWNGTMPACRACPIGHFRAEVGHGKCDVCPVRSTTTTTASTSITHCMCEEGTKKTPDGQCKAVECTPLHAPENGNVDDECKPESGAECTFSCHPGYVLQGPHVRKCTTNGWTKSNPVCTRCPDNSYKLTPDSLTCLPCPVHTKTVGGPGNSLDDCICKSGFEKKSNGKCENIDECETDNGGCGRVCTDTVGSYFCGCDRPGFTLMEDGKNCESRSTCPVLAQELEHGSLNCQSFIDGSHHTCHFKCDEGYFFVSGENNYITCGYETQYQWSHRMRNVTARLPACTREFYVDTKLPISMTFRSKQPCAQAKAYNQELEERLEDLILDSEACSATCQVVNGEFICEDNEQGGSTILASFAVHVKNPESGAVKSTCDVNCRRGNLRAMLGISFRLRKYIEGLVESSGVNLPNAADAPVVNPDSYVLKNPAIMCLEPGRVLTSNRLCVPCDAGYFLDNSANTTCTPCPKGTFQDKEGQTGCLPCYPGSTTIDEASNHPTMCSMRITIGGKAKREEEDDFSDEEVAIIEDRIRRALVDEEADPEFDLILSRMQKRK